MEVVNLITAMKKYTIPFLVGAALVAACSGAAFNQSSSLQPAVAFEVDTVDADPTMHAHYRVGPCLVVEFTGEWSTSSSGNSAVHTPMSSTASVLVSSGGGELRRHAMTLEGEVAEGAEWFVVRPGTRRGAGSESPWGGDDEGPAVAMGVTPLCYPISVDGPRGDFTNLVFIGDCWSTNNQGPCNTVHSCTAPSGSDCEVLWTTSSGSGGESSACGGNLKVQTYCDGNGDQRVRVCN